MGVMQFVRKKSNTVIFIIYILILCERNKTMGSKCVIHVECLLMV